MKKIRKYLFISAFLLLFFQGFSSNAEVTFYTSVNLLNRFNATLRQYELENGALFEADLGLLEGFILSVENFVGYEDGSVFDELKAGLEVWFIPYLSAGIKPVFFFDSGGFSASLSLFVQLAYDNERIGFSIWDLNDFIILYLDGMFEYVNSFGIEKFFKAGEKVLIGLKLENEFAWSQEEDFAETLTLGPGMWIRFFGMYVNYKMNIVPDLEHNIEIDLVFEYPAKEMK